MANSLNYSHFQSCFRNWIAQQHQDLEELLCELAHDSANHDNDKLKLLVAKSIKHFEDYSERRASMVDHDAPCFLSPSWCSPLENSLLWIGGCRPSLAVRLLYSVAASDHLERKMPLRMINALHCKTIREEEAMTSRMATIQEAIADLPVKRGEVVGAWSDEVERAVDGHRVSLASIVRDADRLRLSTVKELMSMLTPRQGVDLLAATKKLHLSLHHWGNRMNHHSGHKETTLLPK